MIAWLQKWLARLFGIGGLTMEVRMDDWDCPRGSDRRVTVTVRGGIIGQQVHKITAVLADFKKSKNGSQTRSLHTRVLAYNCRVPPDSRQELTFSFRVPDNMRLSSTDSDGEMESGGMVTVTAIPVGSIVQPRASERFSVRIHRETDALAEAMLRLGYLPRAPLPALVMGVVDFLGLSVDEWMPGSAESEGSYVRHFTPPLELQTLYESAVLSLRVHYGWTYATLDLHRRPHALPPHAEHMVTSDHERYSFQLPRQDLVGPEGELLTEAAAQALTGIAEEALIPPDDPRYTLLRPAQSPGDSGATLLRPAAHGPDTAPQTLLRPAGSSAPPDTEVRQNT